MYKADANPEKRFFIDLITRDISLGDAILDLIDNAIDSLIRKNQIDIYQDLLGNNEPSNIKPDAVIKINFTPSKFTITDNCGGISFEDAKNNIFRLGYPGPQSGASLSVFGIGLKRAIFKMGRHIDMESHTIDSGFSMSLDVDQWLHKNENDWRLPIEKENGIEDDIKAGTRIEITPLRKEISEITQNPVFLNKLMKTLQETYPFYLGRYIRIIVKGKEIIGEDLSFGKSQFINPASESWEDGNVQATLICGLLPKENGKWTSEKSGWYIVCNGRVIVHSDKSYLTGWGETLPQFMPKNRGFLGIIFYRSDHPEELPWRTTKRGINSESPVFIRTKKRMITAARPVIQFQNKIYAASEEEPKEEYRESIKDLHTTSATEHAAMSNITDEPQSFKVTLPPSLPTFTGIQFKVKIEEMKRVKKSLGSSWMTNKEAGKRIFKYYLDRECP